MSEKWPEDGVLVSAEGKPFKTENAAKAAASNKGKTEGEFRVIPFGDGFAAELIDSGEGGDNPEVAQNRREAAAKKSEPKSTGYRWVVFSPRASTMEPADVIIGVNGSTLVLPRGVKTILPESYLEAADHTRYQTFRQDPSSLRKTVVELSPYTFQDLGPATKEEYMALLRQGNKQTREKLERSGDLPSTPFKPD